MKNKYILMALLLGCSLTASAQKFTHEVGVSYRSHSGFFHNFDDVSMLYIPGIRYTTGKSYLAALLPLSLTRTVSSARSANLNTIEVPLALEWGFIPGKTGAITRVHSLFFGAGMTAYNSRETENIRGNIVSNHYALAYAGTRIRLGSEYIGLRVSYGRTIDYSITQNHRIGAALTYILK